MALWAPARGSQVRKRCLKGQRSCISEYQFSKTKLHYHHLFSMNMLGCRFKPRSLLRAGEEDKSFNSLNSPLEFLLMSKKDKGRFPVAPSVAYELQMRACYFQGQRIQMSLNMLVICSSLLKFFLSEINTQKSIWRLSMKRGNNCNESYSSHITKTRCRAQIIPSIVCQKSWQLIREILQDLWKK